VRGEEARQEVRQLPDAELAGHRDGDVIRFGPQELPDKGRGRPLTVWWEIEVAAGKRGETLALAQTASIQDFLGWLAARNSSGNEPDRPGDGEPAPARPE